MESDEVDEDDSKIGQRSKHRHNDGTGYTSTKLAINITDVYSAIIFLTIKHSDGGGRSDAGEELSEHQDVNNTQYKHKVLRR